MRGIKDHEIDLKQQDRLIVTQFGEPEYHLTIVDRRDGEKVGLGFNKNNAKSMEDLDILINTLLTIRDKLYGR
tara:strand:- start:20778 stop:20996 length:219 start_codon:yes stop_codon:yes gene_type:complete